LWATGQDVQFSFCFFVSDAWTGDDFCRRSRPYAMPLIGSPHASHNAIRCLLSLLTPFSSAALPSLSLSLSLSLVETHTAAIPFVLRFLQCLRKFLGSRNRWHIVNGGKYVNGSAY
jgi:hypothetical protein